MFDFETTSKRTSDTEIIQLAATIINPRNLTVYPGAEFNSMMKALKPELISDSALAKNRKTREEIKAAPHPDEVWHQFANWVSGFNLKGKSDARGAPVPVGYNMLGFDWPIYERYCFKHKTTRKGRDGQLEPSIFNNVWRFDVMQMMAMWTENLPEPEKLSLDAIRKYFSMPAGDRHAHDALQDVRDTAAIYIKLVAMMRGMAPRIIWKDCFDAAKVATEVERRRADRQSRKEREAERNERQRRSGSRGNS